MIINAENAILGRLASYVAKQVLLGEKVEIVNCENAIMTGNRKEIFNQFTQKQSPGDVVHAPKVFKMPNMIVRRTIRSMLPWKKSRGREAYKRIFCYIGIPDNLKDQKMLVLENSSLNKLRNIKYVYIKEISQFLGKELK